MTKMLFSRALRLGACLALLAFCVFDANVRATTTSLLTSGIDRAFLDHTCKPCTNFYQFANGGWIAHHPVPPTDPFYGTFNIVINRTSGTLHAILDQAASSNAALGSNERQAGDFYTSCMNTAAIDKAGTRPLSQMFAWIDGINNRKDVASVLAELQLRGVHAFFILRPAADFKNSSRNIAELSPAGMGLPDRDYYLNQSARMQATRQAYLAHLSTMFTLLGDNHSDTDAQTVMTIETALASSALPRVQTRDLASDYHKMTLSALETLAPNFDWPTYFTASGVQVSSVNLTELGYFKALAEQLGTLPSDQLKAYLRWQVVHTYAATLPQAFEAANFDFYDRTLQGVPQENARWKTCVNATDASLSDALGQLYVAKVFPPAAKARALTLVSYIEQTFRDDLRTLSWMSPQTRARAIEKLDAFTIKVGYPDTWRSYKDVKILRSNYVSNTIATNLYEMKYLYAQIGQPHDKSVWNLSAPTVNAYYDPTENSINFPAGILQPPFFDQHADMPVNFGAIGAVIGHESTHGFDDSGRRFDRNGNLVNWWTAADSANFNRRAQCIVEQFNALSPLPGIHENGSLVQGEAIADLGGLTLAYKAFERWQSTHPRRILDGFTPEQRFFLGWAQMQAQNARPEYVRLAALADVHPDKVFRINATVSNMPAFAKAWGCKIGDAMVRPPKDRCRIW